MKAAFYRGDRNFTVEDIPTAEPGAGEVQIRVAFCGICGTDLHVYQGHMDKRVGFERVIGHEMSGQVEQVGSEVADVSVGDRVVVRPLMPCGSCPACRAGLSHICHRLNFVGLDSDGALQEHWNVDASLIHKVPEGVELSEAALIEPIAVACHVTRRARVSPGEVAFVIGAGPIGLLTGLVAREMGARVLMAEVSPYRRAFAEDMGFEVAPAEAEAISPFVEQSTSGKGADVVFEVSGTQAGAELMTTLAASRGRIAMVAIHADTRKVDLFRFFWRELELIGTRVYEPEDYERAIALVAEGRLSPGELITDVRDLSQINAAFRDLVSDPKAIKSLLRLGSTF